MEMDMEWAYLSTVNGAQATFIDGVVKTEIIFKETWPVSSTARK